MCQGKNRAHWKLLAGVQTRVTSTIKIDHEMNDLSIGGTHVEAGFKENCCSSLRTGLAVDMNKCAQAFGFDSFQYCGIECGAARSRIVEEVQSGFMMLNFNTGDLLPIPVRGDTGVRYVDTGQLAVGYIPVTAPAGSLYPSVGQRKEVERQVGASVSHKW